MKRLLFTVLLVAGFWPGSARAAPYWVAWEGNDYPENEGWTRIVEGDGPAVRTLIDGILTVDSLWSMQVSDGYRIDRSMNPNAGEYFLMRWHLRVHQVLGPWPYDPALALFSDDDWGLGFQFGEDELRSTFEGTALAFEPGVFHEFELRSPDMRTYELSLDGAIALVGTLWEPAVTRSYVAWGDGIRGSASVCDWDYFEFGVVPEPQSGLFILTFAAAVWQTILSRRTP